MLLLWALLVCLLLLGIAMLWLGRRWRRASGVPVGEVIYRDTDDWEAQEKPLFSRRYGLVGRPDYLVRVVQSHRGRRAEVVIPVEVKSRTSPGTVYESHALQLATYCLLVEDRFGQRPPYGLLHYADATFEIPFTDALRRQVLDAADEIRRARGAPDVARQHSEPARCAGCGYRHACGDAL